MSWTTERVELLKSLWNEGLSASQVAARMGDVTRNAVIGKVHRLGLQSRAVARTGRPRQESRPVTAAPVAPIAAVPAAPVAAPPPTPADQRATVLTLSDHVCKWPIGDPNDSDFHYCGRKSSVGLPYCADHMRVAYQPAERRRNRRGR